MLFLKNSPNAKSNAEGKVPYCLILQKKWPIMKSNAPKQLLHIVNTLVGSQQSENQFTEVKILQRVRNLPKI